VRIARTQAERGVNALAQAVRIIAVADARRLATCALLAVAILAAPAERAYAQASQGVTSAIGRARSMLDGGNGAAARNLLDSLVARTSPGSDDLAEALYWRAVLSERVNDGEKDWKRLVVDVPLSPRVPDALLRLGELEILRGRADVARAHFERIVRDFNDSPQRPKAMVWIARSYFEERDLVHACEAVTALRASPVPEGELRLQADEMHVRCTSAATSTPTPASPPAEAAAPSAAAADQIRYSLQFAAYDTKSQATALMQRLTKRGYKARIDGDRKPYRVRVGRYETKAEANAALARVKKAGQKAIVVELPK
jgi:cell division septation protein DedD